MGFSLCGTAQPFLEEQLRPWLHRGKKWDFASQLCCLMAHVERTAWDKPLEHWMEIPTFFMGVLKELRWSYHTGPALKSRFKSRTPQTQLQNISNSDPEHLKLRSRTPQIQLQNISNSDPESLEFGSGTSQIQVQNISNSTPEHLKFGSRISQTQLQNLSNSDPEHLTFGSRIQIQSCRLSPAPVQQRGRNCTFPLHFLSLHPFLTSP